MMRDSVFEPRDCCRKAIPATLQQCNTRAVVARISTGPIGFEHRTFDCTICNYAEEVVLAVDPRRAGATGWLATT
jgi:hypothetical protein